MTSTPPPPLPADAALFIDVDGTLLEIASRPELVRVPPELPRLLERLQRERDGALALISGRRIADLDRLLRPWRGAAAGLHGAERRLPGGTCLPPGESLADQAAAAALARLRPHLLALVRSAPGTWLEDKQATLALHYRDAPEQGTVLHGAVERLLADAGHGLRLIAGKMVLELQPRHHGKGRAIAGFLADPPFHGRVPVFLGDDATDEDGFAEINRRDGVSIRIGAPLPSTAAAYLLPSVAAAIGWLAGTQPP